MQSNPSKINKFLLVAVIILLVGIVLMFSYMQKTTENNDNYPINQSDQINNVASNLEEKNEEGWVKSPQFGLKIPSGVEVYEGDKDTPTYDKFAELSFKYDGAIISWGGKNTECMDNNQYGEFKYGVSTVACIAGLRAIIGLENVRDTISQKALNIFGDFVIKNQ